MRPSDPTQQQLMASLEQLTRLLLAGIDDVARVASLLDTAMQQAPHPALELSMDGVILYLNGAASEVIGMDPQRVVGTRLATYVSDGLMTQRRLDGLSQRSQPQSWPDAWRRERQTIPCQLTGFALPRALGGERPRLVVWSERPGAAEAENPLAADGGPPAETLLPIDRHLLGRDLEPLRRKLNLGINRFCELLGISAVTWYAWRKNAEALIPSRTTVLHLRLLDAMPDLAKPGAQPAELQEALRAHRDIYLSYTDLALLMGVERRAGYSWSHGYPASDQAQALTATLLHLVFEKPREAWEGYRNLVERQAELEKTDIGATKSWSAAARGESDESTEPAPDAPPASAAKRGRPPRTQINPPASATLRQEQDRPHPKSGDREERAPDAPPARAPKRGKIARTRPDEPALENLKNERTSEPPPSGKKSGQRHF